MIYYNMITKVKIPKTQSNNQIIESYGELTHWSMLLIDMKIIIMIILGLINQEKKEGYTKENKFLNKEELDLNQKDEQLDE